MADIVLSALNAKHIHTAFGLRYLMANLGPLAKCAQISEYDINQRPLDIVEDILAQHPKILGLGVYIWNVTATREVIALLKLIQPKLKVVIGGPEVSYETSEQEIIRLADYLITGEADLKFQELCQQLLAGILPPNKFIVAKEPDLELLQLPYPLYTDEDIKHRMIYVEATRGCPLSCDFCLSSLDKGPLRKFPIQTLYRSFMQLLERGAVQFKFVDRSFNLNSDTGVAILEFFLNHYRPGLFLHFEMIPDYLSQSLKDLLIQFPAGALQLEIGIQSLHNATLRRINRRQNPERLIENLIFLHQNTSAHIHTDLIVGLPGESIEDFGIGFNQLLALNPQEIQISILKRLRGAPIIRHTKEWQMVFSPYPPYEILKNKLIDHSAMQKMRLFARFWDLIGNSGNFKESRTLLWRNSPSPFDSFLRFSEWLFARAGRRHSISLTNLVAFLFEYLHEVLGFPANESALALLKDYQKGGRSDVPVCLRNHLPNLPSALNTVKRQTPKRQRRHLS
jgi:radical SAM superfamily enzyme YgiQ (UPF0313 family)